MMSIVQRDDALVTAQGDLPQPGRYRHFKGGEYELLSVARHSETEELFVVYRSVAAPDATWIRPLEMFAGYVERPDGLVPRFRPASHRVRGGVVGRVQGAVDRLGGRSARQPLHHRF